jgi:putative FmdB family regulatory protein
LLVAEEAPDVPLYEYQCPKCGRFEVIRKFSDPPLEACPTCGSAIQKLMSAPAIQFKGTGWYITDYARKDGKSGTGASGESKGAKGEGGSSEGKSEAKGGSEKSGEGDTGKAAKDSPAAPARSSEKKKP